MNVFTKAALEEDDRVREAISLQKIKHSRLERLLGLLPNYKGAVSCPAKYIDFDYPTRDELDQIFSVLKFEDFEKQATLHEVTYTEMGIVQVPIRIYNTRVLDYAPPSAAVPPGPLDDAPRRKLRL